MIIEADNGRVAVAYIYLEKIKLKAKFLHNRIELIFVRSCRKILEKNVILYQDFLKEIPIFGPKIRTKLSENILEKNVILYQDFLKNSPFLVRKFVHNFK